MIKQILHTILKITGSVLCLIVGIINITSISPIYNFEEPKPFEGEYIYNPYENFDSLKGWTRANFHTHTHSTNWINECEFYPDSVLGFYKMYGYDFVSFSNHMELTKDPVDTLNQTWVYEHGYNFFKYHNLTFNPSQVQYWDILLPLSCSQKQFKINILERDADFVVFNHPDRTFFTSDKDMKYITNYRLIEHDCGFSEKDTYGHKWDIALSNGHYVPSIISDDLHKPRLTARIARRCSFLNTASKKYTDIKNTLLSGNFYTMHLPDFGDGNIDEKIKENKDLPAVENIGISKDSIYISLSKRAKEIKAIGQNGIILKKEEDTNIFHYIFNPADTYVRLDIRFENGIAIFTNPFARWNNNTESKTPYVKNHTSVNWGLSIIYNLLVFAITICCFTMFFILVRKHPKSCSDK